MATIRPDGSLAPDTTPHATVAAGRRAPPAAGSLSRRDRRRYHERRAIGAGAFRPGRGERARRKSRCRETGEETDRRARPPISPASIQPPPMATQPRPPPIPPTSGHPAAVAEARRPQARRRQARRPQAARARSVAAAKKTDGRVAADARRRRWRWDIRRRHAGRRLAHWSRQETCRSGVSEEGGLAGAPPSCRRTAFRAKMREPIRDQYRGARNDGSAPRASSRPPNRATIKLDKRHEVLRLICKELELSCVQRVA